MPAAAGPDNLFFRRFFRRLPDGRLVFLPAGAFTATGHAGTDDVELRGVACDAATAQRLQRVWTRALAVGLAAFAVSSVAAYAVMWTRPAPQAWVRVAAALLPWLVHLGVKQALWTAPSRQVVAHLPVEVLHTTRAALREGRRQATTRLQVAVGLLPLIAIAAVAGLFARISAAEGRYDRATSLGVLAVTLTTVPVWAAIAPLLRGVARPRLLLVAAAALAALFWTALLIGSARLG